MKKNTKKVDIIIIIVMLLIVAVFLCSIVGKKGNAESTRGKTYTSFEDLKEARIGVMTGSTFDELIHVYFSEVIFLIITVNRIWR